MSLKRICVRKEKLKCPKIPHCPKIPVVTLISSLELVSQMGNSDDLIANLIPSFPDLFRLTPIPPESKNIWPIKKTSQQREVYVEISIADTQC